MPNIERLKNLGQPGLKIFADTVSSLKYSQGFYGRLERSINELDSNGFEILCNTLLKQDFRNSLDVVMFLEA